MMLHNVIRFYLFNFVLYGNGPLRSYFDITPVPTSHVVAMSFLPKSFI